MPKGDRAILKADPADGMTQVANLLLEALAMAHLSGEEKGAVLFLWRRTYGWQNGAGRKTKDEISLPEWAAALNTSKDYSARVIKNLVQKNIIMQGDLGKGRGYIYSMNTRVNQWDRSSLNGLLLSERYSQGLSKKYTPQSPKRTTPSDTDLARPKEILNKVKDIPKGDKHTPLNEITNIFQDMKDYLGYPGKIDKDPIPSYGKEGQAIKRMLTRGFTREEIMTCWKGKVDQRGGEFVSMTWVNEDIGKPGKTDGVAKFGKRTLPTRKEYTPQRDDYPEDDDKAVK